MRWPLRNQLFFPFAALLILVVVVVMMVSIWSAVRLQRAREFERIKSVTVSLGEASFPLTPDIVERVSGMVGGEVVVLDRVDQPSIGSLDVDATLEEQLKQLKTFGRESFESQSLEIDGQEYLVGAIERTRSTRRGTLYVLIPRSRLDVAIRESFVAPALVAIPTLAIALLIAMMLARRVAGRVERLRGHFGDLADGRFNSIEASGRNDEIQDLLSSANELSGQLESLQEEVVRSERLGLLSQLSGGLAHQLRNSITGARLAIQMHQENHSESDDGMLNTALAQLRLTEEQVLAVLSLRSGQDKGQRAKANVQLMLKEIIELIRPQTHHWNTHVATAIDGRETNLVRQFVSPASVKGAILNVALNAVQAAGVDGRIQLRTMCEDASICVEVLDSGPGFENDLNPAEAFRTTKEGGVGIGLTIAQHAVQQESGEMIISRRDGWTSVKFVFPPTTGEA